jgi:hypothetical protein
MRIEVVGDLLFELRVTFVLGIANGREQLSIAPRLADVFGLVASIKRG